MVNRHIFRIHACMHKQRGSVTIDKFHLSAKLNLSYHLIAPFLHPLAQIIQLLFILDCTEWPVFRKTVQHDYE